MHADESNFVKTGHKWTLGKQIDATKLQNNYKLTPLLNRRSYNEHKVSDNFINLLEEEERSSARRSLQEQNIKLSNAVLHNGVKLLHSNEKGARCLPSKELFQRSAICFKASLPDNMSVDVASQSEFASQTLKPLSTQNMELIYFDDSCDCQNGNANYKLKETSPGCLPSKKGKSKKLQRKDSYKTEQEFNDESPNNNKEVDRDDVKISDKNNSNKVRRKSSFISSVIKFAKFGRKKKRSSEETHETSDDSNWGTESSEEKRDSSSCQDEEFIFGGVRVFFDENGEFCEVDQDDYHDDQSVSSFSSDNESECDVPTRRNRTRKFESSDSLNLGYSGSFVT